MERQRCPTVNLIAYNACWCWVSFFNPTNAIAITLVTKGDTQHLDRDRIAYKFYWHWVSFCSNLCDHTQPTSLMLELSHLTVIMGVCNANYMFLLSLIIMTIINYLPTNSITRLSSIAHFDALLLSYYYLVFKSH